MTRNSIWLLLTFALLSPAHVLAQRAQEEEQEPLVIKVYRVSDLVVPAPDYPYEGTQLPHMIDGTPRITSGGGMGGGMGGMGGGMMGGMGGGMGGGAGQGGMGGGMFKVPDYLAQRAGGAGGGGAQRAARVAGQSSVSLPHITIDRLIEAITDIVEPATWDEVGGLGAISPLGGALAIRQTASVHAKVQEFLEALKREIGTSRMLTIEARWIELDSAQLAQLRGNATGKAEGGEVIDAKALAALPPEAERYAGQLTCFNGQTVHLISGRLESVINGAIPVVGAVTAYQPIMFAPHLGVLLQATPATLPQDEGVMIDLHSTVTRLEKSLKPAQIGQGSGAGPTIEIDRINVTAQQFATSLRMPLDRPVLVGGITFPNAGESPQAAPAGTQSGGKTKSGGGLYLVVKVHASER